MEDVRGGDASGDASDGRVAGETNQSEAVVVLPIVVDGRLIELMTLPQVATRLALPTELGGRAPALVSLKRWSAAGVLQQAQHFPAGRNRPLYDYKAVREICLSKLPMRFDDLQAQPAALASSQQAPQETGTPGPGGQADPELLARLGALEAASERRHEEFRQVISQLTQQISRMASAAENLEHTRKSLMNRYDAELSGLRSQLEQMQTASKASSGPGLDITAARLQQAAARIEAAVLRAPDGH